MPEQIEQYMRTLKLGGMAREWRGVEFQNTEQYVQELLELELREREVNRINRMVKTADFQVLKTLEDFVWNQNIELPVGLTKKYMEGLQMCIRDSLHGDILWQFVQSILVLLAPLVRNHDHAVVRCFLDLLVRINLRLVKQKAELLHAILRLSLIHI